MEKYFRKVLYPYYNKRIIVLDRERGFRSLLERGKCMYRLKSHEFEDLEKFRSFVEHLKNKEGHIELKIRAYHDHDVCPSDLKVGSLITEKSIQRFVYCEIYYLDESENYPEYVFVCMNGTIIVAQDMLHYGVY